MTSIHITPAEELCDAWDAAANESHSLTDVITTGDIVVGAKAMRRLKKAIEAITGCQPGILADYRGPRRTPPVTGCADEPAQDYERSEQMSGIYNRLAALERENLEFRRGFLGFSKITGDLKGEINFITERVGKAEVHIEQLGGAVFNPPSLHPPLAEYEGDEPTPDQPAARQSTCHDCNSALSGPNAFGECIGTCSRIQPQPAADDAEKRTAHVTERRWLEPLVVAEDFDDLEPVIDPESPEQHAAVMSVLEKAITVPRRSQLDTLAGDILTALAGQIGGTNG